MTSSSDSDEANRVQVLVVGGRAQVDGTLKMEPLNIDTKSTRYRALIGVGGIGSGVFFLLKGNHTLGREESRGGRFLDRRDYCKLHIVTHYVQTLLGPGFACYPIGFVGEDESGKRLLKEMTQAGLRLDYVRALPGEQTLFSTCFVYPDGSGGNLTTDDSANSKVGPGDVRRAESRFRKLEGAGIAVALPEAALETRLALLEMATAHRFFRAASLTSEEVRSVYVDRILTHTDLLAINLDEAAALGGMSSAGTEPVRIVEGAVRRARDVQPKIRVSITAGKSGSWMWDGATFSRRPAIDVEAVSTAGAGDAHFAGVLTGFLGGLGFHEAQELGVLVAAVSVTSPHTIHPGMDRAALRRLAETAGVSVSPAVRRLLT